MVEFSRPFKPDAEALLANFRREGTPKRVHFMELFQDQEINQAVCDRFGLADGISPDDEYFWEKRETAIQRFLGYDYIYVWLGLERTFFKVKTEDTAELAKANGRYYQDEHHGPIMSWEDFEKYDFPDPAKSPTKSFEWFEKNLPGDMCVIPNCGASLCEFITWSMGYETLCYALYDQRDLVAAIADKWHEVARGATKRLLEFDCVKAVWGSDDMGFKTATLISPDDIREFVLPAHKEVAEMCHAAGRPYLLHSCGQLKEIMPDLIDDVKIDAKHSFEDTIELVTDAKREYGDRIALLGGIDVDFLCRNDEQAVRKRVRETLDVCMPGGGYCLGSGNSVTNYVPLDNYLAMLDEGRRYAG